jgi:hypothetical protein
MLPALQRSISDWERYERLEITLRLATGDILLTSLALAPRAGPAGRGGAGDL